MIHFNFKKLFLIGSLLLASLSIKAYEMVIPEGITEITKRQYANDSTLTTLVLPQSLQTIEVGAFENCINLDTIIFSNDLIDWSDPFTGCNNITTIIAMNSIDLGQATSVFPQNVIANANVYVPASVYMSTIENFSFSKWQHIFTLPDTTGLEKISVRNDSLIYNGSLSEWLTKFDFTHIEYAGVGHIRHTIIDGQDLNTIETLIIPDDVFTLTENTFQGTYELKEIIFHENVNKFNFNPFTGEFPNLKRLIFKATTPPYLADPLTFRSSHDQFLCFVPEESYEKYIAEFDWREFKHILTLPDTAQTEFDIHNDTLLFKGTITDWVSKNRSEYWFDHVIVEGQDLRTIKSIEVPNGVTTIPKGVFKGCDSIREISIPQSVTNLDAGAFRNHPHLKNIKCHGSIPPIVSYIDYIIDHVYIANMEDTTEVESYQIYAFEDWVYDKVNLYVPYESLSSYKETGAFNRFIHWNVLPNELFSIEGDTLKYNGTLYEWCKAPITELDYNVLFIDGKEIKGNLEFPPLTDSKYPTIETYTFGRVSHNITSVTLSEYINFTTTPDFTFHIDTLIFKGSLFEWCKAPITELDYNVLFIDGKEIKGNLEFPLLKEEEGNWNQMGIFQAFEKVKNSITSVSVYQPIYDLESIFPKLNTIDFKSTIYEWCKSEILIMEGFNSTIKVLINGESYQGKRITLDEDSVWYFLSPITLLGARTIVIPEKVKFADYTAWYGPQPVDTLIYTGDIDSWMKLQEESTLKGDYYYFPFEGNVTIVDGKKKIDVYISGNSINGVGDGETYTLHGYTFESSDPSYTVNDFKFVGNDTIIASGGGVHSQRIYESDFINMNDNYVVTFIVTPGTIDLSYYTTSFDVPSGQTLYGQILSDNTIKITYPNYGITQPGEYMMDERYYKGYEQPEGNVVIPDVVTIKGKKYSVTEISENAFIYCKKITSLKLPQTLISIGEGAFEYIQIEEITIPENVTSIGDWAFNECSKLKKVVVEGSIPSYQYTFASCPIESITFKSSALPKVFYPFYNYGVMSSSSIDIICPCGMREEYKELINQSYQSSKYKAIILEGDLVNYGDLSYLVCGEEATVFRSTKDSITSFVIPSTIQYGESATNVTKIQEGLFYENKTITSVTIPSTMETIGDKAFYGCSNLKKITCYSVIPPSAPLTAFSNYNGYLYMPCDYLDDYDMHECWGTFKHVECLKAESSNVTDIEVNPNFEDAEFAWPTSSEADNYSLEIIRNGGILCTLNFNADGQLVNIDFSSSNKEAAMPAPHVPEETSLRSTSLRAGSTGYKFTVTGLSEGTTYGFSLDALNDANTVIKNYSGQFTTKGAPADGGSTTSLKKENSEELTIYAADKTISVIANDNQIVSIFNLQGQCVYHQAGNANFQAPSTGVYVVRCGDKAVKVIVK